jgi:inhibitor of cysteine peptidase
MADDHPVSRMRASGGSVQIELPETPTSGYRWELENNTPAIVVVESKFEQSEAGRLAGASGIRKLVLHISQRGTSRVRLVLKRSWETTAIDHREIDIDVD